MTARPLSGARILILEDDYYQAHDSRETLEAAGATIVAIGSRVPDLATLLAKGPLHCALIDINLGERMSFGFARELQAKDIPFMFLSGYGASILPEDLAAVPCLSKPAEGARVIAELTRLLGR